MLVFAFVCGPKSTPNSPKRMSWRCLQKLPLKNHPMEKGKSSEPNLHVVCSMLIFQGVDQSWRDRCSILYWLYYICCVFSFGESTSMSGMIVLHDVLWFASSRGCTALDFNQDQFAVRIARKKDGTDELSWNLEVLSNFWEWTVKSCFS